MKTKVLLSTMVLAAALAGCSQDEWSVNNANTGNLDNRRAAGNVQLTVSMPSTRMELDGDQVVWSDDDKMGAYLMDEFKGVYPVTSLTNYAQTNYPFEKVDGKTWKSQGVLLEGNYFFTYPFKKCQQNRGAVTNTVPVDQYVYDENGEFGPKQSYLDNQFYVGYRYIEAEKDCEEGSEVGELKVDYKAEPIHAYPSFRFVNQTGSPLDQPLKVYKVSLRKKDQSMFYNTVALFPKAKNFETNSEVPADEARDFALWKTAVYNPNMPDQPHYAYPFSPSEVCSSKTLEYNLIFPEGGLEVQNWSDFKVWMIVPAGVYGPMQVVLYTNEGVGTFDIDMPNNQDDGQVQSGTYVLTPEKRAEFNVRVDISSLKTNKYDFTVQSTENFEEYLSYLGETTNTTKVSLTTIGNNVELSAKAYEILTKEHTGLKLKLNGTLVIPEDVPADAIDLIEYYSAGARLINKGTQVITETPMKEKATIGAANVRIDNFGTLTLQAAMPASMINNYATLTVEKSAVHTLLNMPEATTTVTDELNAINLINMGQMDIAAGAEVNVLSKWMNIGTTNNNGTITTWPMDMTNPAFISLTKAEITDVEFVWEWFNRYHLDIDVLVDVYNAFIAASAEAVNYGVINNNENAIIDCKGVIVRSSIENIMKTWYGPHIEFDLTFDITDEVAAVTSLVNLGSASTINTYGRIANLSNFGMLVPQPGSTTSLVEMEADNLFELDKANEAAKLYVQGGLAFYGYGFIDQTNNDKKAVSDQAQISGQGEALRGDQQIIFVKRTDSTNFNTTEDETSNSAPKYINTIWFEDATTTISTSKDISEYDFWMSGTNTITVQQNQTLTLGTVAITGTANYRGQGTVKLTKDIYVNGGTLNADNKAWTADSEVAIWGYNREDNELNTEGAEWSSNIKIDYASFDYVGPWIVIE